MRILIACKGLPVRSAPLASCFQKCIAVQAIGLRLSVPAFPVLQILFSDGVLQSAAMHCSGAEVQLHVAFASGCMGERSLQGIHVSVR